MKNTPKILYLITKSNYGGAQKYVHELALEAKQRGYDVAVACGGTGEKNALPGKLVEKLLADDIAVKPIKHFMRDMSPLDDMQAFFEIVKLLLREKPDILHVTSSKAGGIGAFAGQLTGVKKIIFTSHGLTMDEIWRPLWQRALITWSTWLTIFLSTRSIMISTETLERVKKLPFLKKRVSLILNGINAIEFKDKAIARTELLPQVPKDTVWIGGVGELHANKNWQSLIEATASLPPRIHTVIIGEGEQRKVLEAQIKKLDLTTRVHLLGFVDAPKYLKIFDIFVLPSLKEGLPYVLLEAGLAKLPVVASDLPGNRDIVAHEYSGILIKPDSIALADTLSRLLDLPDLQKHYGETLHEQVNKKFSMQKMLNETFATYNS